MLKPSATNIFWAHQESLQIQNPPPPIQHPRSPIVNTPFSNSQIKPQNLFIKFIHKPYSTFTNHKLITNREIRERRIKKSFAEDQQKGEGGWQQSWIQSSHTPSHLSDAPLSPGHAVALMATDRAPHFTAPALELRPRDDHYYRINTCLPCCRLLVSPSVDPLPTKPRFAACLPLLDPPPNSLATARSTAHSLHIAIAATDTVVIPQSTSADVGRLEGVGRDREGGEVRGSRIRYRTWTQLACTCIVSTIYYDDFFKAALASSENRYSLTITLRGPLAS